MHLMPSIPAHLILMGYTIITAITLLAVSLQHSFLCA